MEKKKLKLFFALLGLAMGGTATGAMAASPTLISSSTGFNCYNFNDYIPSTDSPVVGGWMTYASGEHYIAPFGQMCTNSKFGAISGIWYSAGAASVAAPWEHGCGDNGCAPLYVDIAPGMFGICPNNTATIKIDKYLRSDGVWMIPPASKYVGGPGGFVESPSKVYLCVKTDTYN